MTLPCEQRIVRFFGCVQGVGFRYTACRTARDYAVGGYVRNMSDGSVECVVEGAKAEIDSFIEALCQTMADYVDRKTEQSPPGSGRYRSFDVRF